MSADCRLSVTVREARDAAEFEAAMRLRQRVFCDEQGVTKEEEFDGLDAEAVQIVAVDEKDVVATCRLRFADDPRVCKLERMVVDARLRRSGVGAKLVAGAESEAAARGAEEVVLNAQTRAEDFYASCGYRPEGKRFVEARIEHVRMRKAL